MPYRFNYILLSKPLEDLNKEEKVAKIIKPYETHVFFTLITTQISCSSINPIKVDRNEKYYLNESVNSDKIVGQLKTAEKLKLLMSEKKYEEAMLLFSVRQQKRIKELKKETEMFNYWCLAWTFDESKFERYTNRIKSGNGDFTFEENEWKIDEK